MKRIVLFLITNVGVLLVLSVTARLLGLDRMLGGGMGGLLLFCAFMGFGGAFISLAISKWSAKRMTGAVVIESPSSSREFWLVETVRKQAEKAGIGMPEVAIYDSPDVNAFATGMTRNSALVAVSTGLLNNMRDDEIEAVLAHEVSHIANGDMVTLTLIQGVVNTFVFFLARVIGQVIDRVVFKSESGQGVGYYATVFIAEMVLGILASIVVMWFSRQREFSADAGAASLSSRGKMIAALEALQRAHQPAALPSQVAAMGISGGVAGGLKRLFMTHPPLEERIEVLRAGL
ncbi:MAG: protease HtpX [Burkholderiales bacterium]|jgi:heat shock protein HtpX|nr:protease HtpX [Burkholderiales bacterium]